MHIAVIPTLEMGRCLELIYFISKCHVRPDRVYIINNSGKEYTNDLPPDVEVINSQKNIGVNASWNFGLRLARTQSSHLPILNDDTRIKEDFFKRINYLLSLNRLYDVPVFCPDTIFDAQEFDKLEVDNLPSKTEYMRKREGWAFTIRDRFIEGIKPIPEEFFLFYGDDWIWRQTVPKSSPWLKDRKNIIYHAVGASKLKDPWVVHYYKKEKAIWQGLH